MTFPRSTRCPVYPHTVRARSAGLRSWHPARDGSVVSWRHRRAARAHDLSRCRRREHLDRATWAMGQLGPISTRGMPSAGPFPRVLAHDPADSLRLRYHNVGSPRTSAGGSLIGLRWGIHPAGTSSARMLASSAHPYLPPRFAQSQRKTQGKLLPAHWRVIMPRRHLPTIGARRRAPAGTRLLVGLLLDAAGRCPMLLTTCALGRPNPGRLWRSSAPGRAAAPTDGRSREISGTGYQLEVRLSQFANKPHGIHILATCACRRTSCDHLNRAGGIALRLETPRAFSERPGATTSPWRRPPGREDRPGRAPAGPARLPARRTSMPRQC